ncbi:MAG: hypothetical protein L6437_15560 [Kiritimatiellae bacterium]|nr:hypothetical protein [Kiritimatiellia bacterium]
MIKLFMVAMCQKVAETSSLKDKKFSFALARKLLVHYEATPLHLDMRSVLDKIAESLDHITAPPGPDPCVIATTRQIQHGLPKNMMPVLSHVSTYHHAPFPTIQFGTQTTAECGRHTNDDIL